MTEAINLREELGVLPDLSDLPDDRFAWCDWPHWRGIVRRLDDTRFVAVTPFMYTHAIIIGWIGDTTGYEDRWCYHDAGTAIAAASAWDGVGEPEGWHRHPSSGRRRDESGREWINP